MTTSSKVDTEIDSLFQSSFEVDTSSIISKVKVPKLLDIVADLKSKSDAKNLLIKEERERAEAKALLEEETKQALIEERNASLHEETPERLARTLFVGNVPISVLSSKTISRKFKSHFEVDSNQIESLRFRSIAVVAELSKRVAVITGKISETHDTCNAYIVLTPNSSPKTLSMSTNGTLFEGKHLRVDVVGKNSDDTNDSNTNKQHSTKKSIFIGNLSHAIKDESLWESFSSCGPISYVRVIREKGTGKGKGFGYVAFKDRSSIELALKLDGTKCEGRKMRIKRCAKEGYQEKKKAHNEKRANAIKAIKDKVMGKKSSKEGEGEVEEPNKNKKIEDSSYSYTKNPKSSVNSLTPMKKTPQEPAQKRVGRKPEPLIPKHITEIQKEKVIRTNKRISPPQKKKESVGEGMEGSVRVEHPAALRKKRKDLSSKLEDKRLSVLSKKKKI